MLKKIEKAGFDEHIFKSIGTNIIHRARADNLVISIGIIKKPYGLNIYRDKCKLFCPRLNIHPRETE